MPLAGALKVLASTIEPWDDPNLVPGVCRPGIDADEVTLVWNQRLSRKLLITPGRDFGESARLADLGWRAAAEKTEIPPPR
jgi:hypothetical protein